MSEESPPPDPRAETVVDLQVPEGPPPATWRQLGKSVLIGGALISFPFVPVAWFLRTWVLGWMLELVSRVARHGTSTRHPSWRPAWTHFKRGFRFLLEVFALLVVPSGLLYLGWTLGWINSFEKVHDYRSLAFQVFFLGYLTLAPCFVYLPVATIHAALHPGERASWRLGEVRALAGSDPLLYGPLLLVTYFTWFPLQFLRAPRLQEASQFLLAGWVSFAVILAQKLLWARYYHRAARKLGRGEHAGPWLRRICGVPIWTLALLYGFGITVVQFIQMNPSEWFAHVTYLLPGAPAPLGQEVVYW